MYYILAFIALTLAYSLVTKLVSSLVKGCAVILGLALLAVLAYIFITSSTRPVNIFDLYVVEDFSVRKVED